MFLGVNTDNGEKELVFHFKVIFFKYDKPIAEHLSKMIYDTDAMARRAAWFWLKHNKGNYIFDDYSISTLETSAPPSPKQPKLF